MSKETLKLALEALEYEAKAYAVHNKLHIPKTIRDAITAIKEALAQPEQEPVAIADGTFNHNCILGTPIYTTPPHRTWVGLTDEEKKNIFLKWYGKHWAYTEQVQAVMDSVEAKLRSKNNG